MEPVYDSNYCQRFLLNQTTAGKKLILVNKVFLKKWTRVYFNWQSVLAIIEFLAWDLYLLINENRRYKNENTQSQVNKQEN